MSNVVDIKKAKKIKKIADGITSDEAQRLYDEMKDEILTIESTLAETLDKLNPSMIGAAVALQIFTQRICDISGYSMEYIQKGAKFYYKSE